MDKQKSASGSFPCECRTSPPRGHNGRASKVDTPSSLAGKEPLRSPPKKYVTRAGTLIGLLSRIYCRNPSGPKKKLTGVKTKVRPNRLQGSASFFNRGADPWSRINLTVVLLPVSFFLVTVLWAGPGINSRSPLIARPGEDSIYSAIVKKWFPPIFCINLRRRTIFYLP